MTSCLQSRRSPTELQPHSFQVYKPSNTPNSISFTQIQTVPTPMRLIRESSLRTTAIVAVAFAIAASSSLRLRRLAAHPNLVLTVSNRS